MSNYKVEVINASSSSFSLVVVKLQCRGCFDERVAAFQFRQVTGLERFSSPSVDQLEIRGSENQKKE
jgi:hypothetical protein